MVQSHPIIQKQTAFKCNRTGLIHLAMQRWRIYSWNQMENIAERYNISQSNQNMSIMLGRKIWNPNWQPKTMLNKRSELVSKCRHKAKFKLNNLENLDIFQSLGLTVVFILLFSLLLLLPFMYLCTFLLHPFLLLCSPLSLALWMWVCAFKHACFLLYLTTVSLFSALSSVSAAVLDWQP